MHDWEPEWVSLAKDTVEGVLNLYPQQAVQSASASDCGEPRGTQAERMMMVTKRPRLDPPNELHKYLTSWPADVTVDVLQWWKINCLAHPRLSNVARDYLAIPATGAPVERVFSGGANLVSPKRGCLAASTIRACLCLKGWKRFFKRWRAS